jgi:adenylyltransferase/sulfurtransferase
VHRRLVLAALAVFLIHDMESTPQRFDRQIRFLPEGAAGQKRLEESTVLVVGCGARGGSLAQTMVRAGVGRVVLVDRDIVEPTNLPRQVLFEERHALQSASKAFAAQETLLRIGGPTRIEAHAQHLDGQALKTLAADVHLVLDGTDNLSTRYLINDYCVSRKIPWIYGGVLRAHGLVLGVLPDLETPGACLRCLFPEPPPAQSMDTCETAGVILPAVSAVAALQSAVALRWLSADHDARRAMPATLVQLDVWTLEFLSINASQAADCPCCVRREFPFLDADSAREAVVLCGRNTVQVRGAGRIDMAQFKRRITEHASSLIEAGPLLRFEVEGLRVTLFPDGRALVEGTEDKGRARAVYDRYIGS